MSDTTPRPWLARPCPDCGVRPHFSCRDADGFFADTHPARFEETT